MTGTLRRNHSNIHFEIIHHGNITSAILQVSEAFCIGPGPSLVCKSIRAWALPSAFLWICASLSRTIGRAAVGNVRWIPDNVIAQVGGGGIIKAWMEEMPQQRVFEHDNTGKIVKGTGTTLLDWGQVILTLHVIHNITTERGIHTTTAPALPCT